MRVIAGTARGIPLIPVEGDTTRPILDRVKESLFSILTNDIVDSKIIDLFAGTGGLGIEALSRGAKSCVFVDKEYNAIKSIKKNLEKTRLNDKATVIKSDVFTVDSNTIFGNHISGNCVTSSIFGEDLVKNITNNNVIHEQNAEKLQFSLALVGVPYVLVEQEESKELLLQLFKRFVEKQIIEPDGIIVLQHRKQKLNFSEELYKVMIFDVRVYGITQLTFLKPVV